METFKDWSAESCVKYLEKIRWGDEPICPYCSSTNTNPLKKELRHHCNGCRKSFKVTVGTIFQGTHIPLNKWFAFISLVLGTKKNLQIKEIARDLKMQKSAIYLMMKRFKKAKEDKTSLFLGS